MAKMIKKGASTFGLKPEILIAWDVANDVYDELGVDCVLTCGSNGKHGIGSLHYVGLAIDIRIRDLTKDIQPIVKKRISDRLNDEYDVVLESDHMHLEYQPK